MIPDWQKCDDHGGFGFKSDCLICNGETMMSEATISINGYVLTRSQSMTVRVALESFAMDVNRKDAEKIERLYFARIKEIRKYLYPESPTLIDNPVAARYARLERKIECGAEIAAQKLVDTAYYMVENGCNYSRMEEIEGFKQTIISAIKGVGNES